jgi:hypothetical protein
MGKDKNRTKNITGPAKRISSRSSWMSALSDVPPFVHFLFIFILLITLFLLFIFSGSSNLNPLYKEAKKVSEEGKVLTLRHDVYGDHYVNDLAIDKNRTNFYYDNITTAFTFTPNYTWQDGDNCINSYCSLDPSDWNFPGVSEKEYCLNNNCLKLVDANLFFNEEELSIPGELKDKEIRNVNIYGLSDTWLIGFVFKDGDNREKGLAYQFDGRNFINLDSKQEFPFVSREKFEGATIGFGGNRDNFLVMYGGYDFLGYQVVGNKKIDISRFLGLRVSGGGFSPVAIEKKEGDETIWYICSLEDKEPRLIKLWQNSSSSIKGSLSLTKILLEDREKASSAWCRLNNDNNLEVLISGQGRYYTKVLVDSGFIQKDSVLVTNNLVKKNIQLDSATFSSLLACDDVSCDSSVIKNSITFSVSSDGNNFVAGVLDKEIKFKENSTGLYYSLAAKSRPETRHYSPWIDGLTAISYAYWE